jgi:SAM-dependent methyltransferase
LDYTNLNHCRGCHAPSDDLRVVLEMEPMPLAGQFCPTREEALSAKAYPLTWVQCGRCGLVQVLEDIRDDILFSHYNYASSTVGGLVRHFEDYADFLVDRFGKETSISLLEIGCNDGVLLSRLPGDWSLTGTDPSDVADRAARSQDRYELLNEPWTFARAKELGWENRFDVITGSNCLAHISDLKDVFEAAALALRPGGEFWLEVHDLGATLRGAQWDTIYHEHKVEWSEEALCRVLEPLGLRWKETQNLPLHGGLLRCGFAKITDGAPRYSDRPEPTPGLEALAEAYANRRECPTVRELLTARNAGRSIAAYGASGRANVYLNQIPELAPAYIVDESPLRAGKFLPRIATPVVAQDRLQQKPVRACLITAWNYRDDIIAKNPAHTGAWLTAFE